MAINRRDEKFETVDGLVNTEIRVHNTGFAGRVNINVTKEGGHFMTFEMSADEADQFAEMLRLSARDARSQS